MKSKLMYYLRFTLAYTHAEIKGIIVLFGMMVLYALIYIGWEWRKKEEQKLEFNPVVWEANYKEISHKSGGRESGGRESGGCYAIKNKKPLDLRLGVSAFLNPICITLH